MRIAHGSAIQRAARLLCVSGLFLGLTVPVMATNAWTYAETPRIASTMKERGNFRLHIQCGYDGRVGIEFVVRPRRPSGTLLLRIDNTVFEANREGVGEYGLMLHQKSPDGRPSADWDKSLLRLLLSGERIVLDGPAVARIPVAARTLSLTTGRAAIGRVAAACGT